MSIFCETLADTGIVVEACESAHMGVAGAYALRRRNPVFAAAWDAALTIARDKLADTLLARSIEGNSELSLRDGVIVGERQVIDNRLGLAILRRLDRLAETGLSVSASGPRGQNAPAPRTGPMDWDLALNALRTSNPDDLAAALAMLKGREVEEVEGPGLFHGDDDSDEDEDEDEMFGLAERCWRDNEERVWMTDFPRPRGSPASNMASGAMTITSAGAARRNAPCSTESPPPTRQMRSPSRRPSGTSGSLI